MEAKTLHIMSGLVFMKQLAKGDVIYRRGQTSDRCYLVVSGLVKELSDDEEIMLQRRPEILKSVSHREALASVSNCNGNNGGMVDAEAPPGYWQCYGAGSLLGEVALITKSAHFSTMIVSGT
jgi:CRP-like cAMP-binding protein